MLVIELNRDAPLDGGTGNAQILQARKEEVVHHLVLAGCRLDKLRMRVDIFDQLIRILAHTEEIRLFLRLLYRTSAVRAVAVHQLAVCPEGLTGRAVPALVISLVDVALFVHLAEHLGDLLFVLLICCTDELIIGGVHEIPDITDHGSNLVHVCLRAHACCDCLLLDLLSVLICARHKADIIALFSLETRDRVRQYDLVGVADMRLAGCIGDRCRDIIWFLFGCFSHKLCPPHTGCRRLRAEMTAALAAPFYKT